MFVFNELDGSYAWYKPLPASPQAGGCGPEISLTSSVAFTQAAYFPKNGPGATEPKALYGITKCASHFQKPLLINLGTPTANGGLAEVVKFMNSSDLTDLHELIHLVSDAGA